jgi:hypothetical protein
MLQFPPLLVPVEQVFTFCVVCKAIRQLAKDRVGQIERRTDERSAVEYAARSLGRIAAKG